MLEYFRPKQKCIWLVCLLNGKRWILPEMLLNDASKFQLHDGPYVSLLQPIICQKMILLRRPWDFLWHNEEVASNIKVAGKWQRQYLKPASRPNNTEIDECFRWSCTSWSRPTCSSVWRSSVTTSLFPLLPESLMVRSKLSFLPKLSKNIVCLLPANNHPTNCVLFPYCFPEWPFHLPQLWGFLLMWQAQLLWRQVKRSLLRWGRIAVTPSTMRSRLNQFFFWISTSIFCMRVPLGKTRLHDFFLQIYRPINDPSPRVWSFTL